MITGLLIGSGEKGEFSQIARNSEVINLSCPCPARISAIPTRGSRTPCMLSGTRTCTAREPKQSGTLAHKREGGRARRKNVDRFRHASFVEGTSFISTWFGNRGWCLSLVFPLFFSHFYSLSVAISVFGEKKRRQIPQARGQPLDRRRRRRRRFCASLLFNSSF